MCDFLIEDHAIVDIAALPDINIAMEKLEGLFNGLSSYDIEDETAFASACFWDAAIEQHLNDYSMQYFLSTNFADDKYYTKRMNALKAMLTLNEDLIVNAECDFSMRKIEDLNADLCRRYSCINYANP